MKDYDEREIWSFNSQQKKSYQAFFRIPQNKYLLGLIEKYGKIDKNTKVLEAGCGWGFFVRKLSEKAKMVYGIDFENKQEHVQREKKHKAHKRGCKDFAF